MGFFYALNRLADRMQSRDLYRLLKICRQYGTETHDFSLFCGKDKLETSVLFLVC